MLPLASSDSHLAILYNDESVLENHHAATTFVLLHRHGLLTHLSNEEYRELRRLMCKTILGTDMASHKHSITDCSTMSVQAVPITAQALAGMEALREESVGDSF